MRRWVLTSFVVPALFALPVSALAQDEVRSLPLVTPEQPGDAAHVALAASGELLLGALNNKRAAKLAAAQRVGDLAARLRADPGNEELKAELRTAVTDALAAFKSGASETAEAALSRLEMIDAVEKLERAHRAALQGAVESHTAASSAAHASAQDVRHALAEARAALVQAGITGSGEPVPPEVARRISTIIRLLRAADEDEALTGAELAELEQELTNSEKQLGYIERSREFALHIAEASRAEGSRIQRFASTFSRRLEAARRRDLYAWNQRQDRALASAFHTSNAGDAAAWKSVVDGSVHFAPPRLAEIPDFDFDIHAPMTGAEILAAIDQAIESSNVSGSSNANREE